MSPKSLATKPNARARRLRAIEAVASMGMTYAEAAAYAGMSPASVGNLMKKPEVRRYMANLQEAHAKKLNVSRERVIEGILESIEHAKMVNEPGTELRGWETIAKMQGYNAPERHIHELPEDTRKALEAMQTMRDEDLYRVTGKSELIELNEDDFKTVN